MSNETKADGYELLTCPKCDSDQLTTSREEEGWMIFCGECDFCWGPFGSQPDLYKKI